ncbi:C-type lectin domain family 2 member D-like [Eretmochelys imbricata]
MKLARGSQGSRSLFGRSASANSLGGIHCEPAWLLGPQLLPGLRRWALFLGLSSADLCPPAGPSCPDGWMGYRGKCYYFSETEGSWTDSRSRCCATGASLAGIDSEHEMAFLLRHQGVQDHWIGLRREQGQPWKWTNSTKFNHLFVIRGGGDCAYLNDLSAVSSLRCTSERHWICTKPDAFTQAQEAAVAGGS